ncbi:hypothetical protein Sjap_019862 [Stephania japonica]|uniref:F-box domain-containing protein n=1 Tax=Stephania japonica TaxID=461633 RepID=A0AAP0F6Y8_9MAGN
MKKKIMKKRKALVGCSDQQLISKKKRKTLIGCPAELGEDIIFEEILPRLPVNSIFRFKSVCKKWRDFLSRDHVFHVQHYEKGPHRTTSTFFSVKTECFFSKDSQFRWSRSPSFIKRPSYASLLIHQEDMVVGSTNGLIYGVRPCDPSNPNSGFTLVHPISTSHWGGGGVNAGYKILRFKVYSSKTGAWRVSENTLKFSGLTFRNYPTAVYTGGKKVFWSLTEHILWFDIGKDAAGTVSCPDHHDNFVPQYKDKAFTEIGVCEGQLSYSRVTIQVDLEIWLLRDENNELEWVKKHVVSLQGIIEENWNVMLRFCKLYTRKQEEIKKQNKVIKRKVAKVLAHFDRVAKKDVAKVLAHFHVVKPLPYSGGELAKVKPQFSKVKPNASKSPAPATLSAPKPHAPVALATPKPPAPVVTVPKTFALVTVPKPIAKADSADRTNAGINTKGKGKRNGKGKEKKKSTQFSSQLTTKIEITSAPTRKSARSWTTKGNGKKKRTIIASTTRKEAKRYGSVDKEEYKVGEDVLFDDSHEVDQTMEEGESQADEEQNEEQMIEKKMRKRVMMKAVNMRYKVLMMKRGQSKKLLMRKKWMMQKARKMELMDMNRVYTVMMRLRMFMIMVLGDINLIMMKPPTVPQASAVISHDASRQNGLTVEAHGEPLGVTSDRSRSSPPITKTAKVADSSSEQADRRERARGERERERDLKLLRWESDHLWAAEGRWSLPRGRREKGEEE